MEIISFGKRTWRCTFVAEAPKKVLYSVKKTHSSDISKLSAAQLQPSVSRNISKLKRFMSEKSVMYWLKKKTCVLETGLCISLSCSKLNFWDVIREWSSSANGALNTFRAHSSINSQRGKHPLGIAWFFSLVVQVLKWSSTSRWFLWTKHQKKDQ